MKEPKIEPHKITKPIQILAIWFVGLLTLVGILLAGAANIEQPPWIPALLVISSISIIPFFMVLIFLLQTRFRTQLSDDEHYSEWLKRKEEFDQIISKLQKSTEDLAESSEEVVENFQKKQSNIEEFTNKLLHIDKVGLIAAFPRRNDAFKIIENAILSEEKHIYLVGTSFRGLIWPGPGEDRIRNAISKRIKASDCEIRFLLTHPAFAHLRQALECIQRKETFSVAQEILETVKILQKLGLPHENIRFIRATPTMFGIMTSNIMMLNPYPYEIQAVASATLIFDSKNGENEVYNAFRRSHFEGVWEDNRNVNILEGYNLEAIKNIFGKNLEDLGLSKPTYHLDYKPLIGSIEKDGKEDNKANSADAKNSAAD